MQERTYYLDVKTNGKFYMHGKKMPYTDRRQAQRHACLMSIGAGSKMIVIVHSVKQEFNDVIGYWCNGDYHAKRKFQGATAWIGDSLLYAHHMHGVESAIYKGEA